MDKKALVLYKSKTGMTKKYAEWLGEMLPCDVIPFDRRGEIEDSRYSVILYGGGFYAGGIHGIKWLKSKLKDWQGKKVIVFATGASPEDSPEVEKALQQNFNQEEWNQIKTFYLRAGICYERMGFIDRILMKMFHSMMRKQQGDSDMVKTIEKSFDFTDKSRLEPVLDYVRALC